MTPEQVVALLQLLADLRAQIGTLAQDNASLRSQLRDLEAAQAATSEDAKKSPRKKVGGS